MRYLKQALFYISLALDRFFHAVRGGAAVRVILIQGGKVVLVRHWLTPGMWALPGGGVKNGESPIDAAKREIFEEIGYTINSFGGEVNPHIFYTKDFDGAAEFKSNFEIMKCEFFELEHLPGNILPMHHRAIEALRD